MSNLKTRQMTDMFIILGIDVIDIAIKHNLHIKRKTFYENIRLYNRKASEIEKEKEFNNNKVKLLDDTRKRLFKLITSSRGFGYRSSYRDNLISEEVLKTKNGYQLKAVYEYELDNSAVMDRRIRPFVNKAKESVEYHSETNTFSFEFIHERFEFEVNFNNLVLHTLITKNFPCLFNFLLFNVPDLKRVN